MGVFSEKVRKWYHLYKAGLTPDASTIWGISSVGRASALQAEGREFNSHMLHHILLLLDGIEGAPYKRVHKVQLFGGVPAYALVIEVGRLKTTPLSGEYK